MPIRQKPLQLELEIDTEVDIRLGKITKIKLQISTDSISKGIGGSKDKSPRNTGTYACLFSHIPITCHSINCLTIPRIDNRSYTDTGIYFPLRYHDIETIGCSNFNINIIVIPLPFPCGLSCRHPICVSIPHVTELSPNRESTFPYASQGIIVSHVGTHNVGKPQFHTKYRRSGCNTIVNAASLSRLNHGHTANCNGRNQCDNHFFHVVVFFV